MTLSGQSFQMESESIINCFSDLMIVCLKSPYICALSLLAYYVNPKLLLSLMYLNTCTKATKYTLPGFDKHFSNLFNAKHKCTIERKR